MKKRKVGLALGGGAARGMAHIGVLEILEKSSIPIDMIAGTSAGAAVGAIYAQGKNTDELKKLAQSWDWKQRAQVIDLALPRSGFIAGHRIKKLLKCLRSHRCNDRGRSGHQPGLGAGGSQSQHLGAYNIFRRQIRRQVSG